jgi:hypothetical protein
VQKISAEFIKTFLASNELPFYATQPKLSIPIIFRICQKMAHGIKFDDIKVCDNLIVDGHHRYLSGLIMRFDIGKLLSTKTSATRSIAWDSVEFDEEDWDTPARIAHLNELDAKYNGLEIEFVKQITTG